MKLLSCQVSTHLINEDNVVPPYYDRLYEALRGDGYAKPHHFWEIPNWAAIVAKNFPEGDFHVVVNRQDTLRFFNDSEYTHICFSVMDANKEIIKNLIDGYTGAAKFILGGYIDFTYFDGYPNVEVYKTIGSFVESQGVSYTHCYDYRHFKGIDTIPRLTLSVGCTYNCMFCTEGKSKVIEADMDSLNSQVESYKDLSFALVYLNDKTFGQAKNHTELPQLFDKLKLINPAFQGFIIQTSTVQFLKFSDEYLISSGIRFVELGVETFNDPILRKYRKPSNTKLIVQATERFRHLPCKFIPNVIIGFQEETYETYAATLKYLEDNADVISHLNVCNLAVYTGTDLASSYDGLAQTDSNEYVLDKSFHVDHGPHHWFSDELFKLGIRLLDAKTKS